MPPNNMPLRFDVDYRRQDLNFDPIVDEVFSELKSSFIQLPRGDCFIDYPTFERGYQALKRTTSAFTNISQATVLQAIAELPIAFVVFRAILGFTPPELAYVTSEMTGVSVEQGMARAIDKRMRTTPLVPLRAGGGPSTILRIAAMIDAGVRILANGPGPAVPGVIHRMDKVDTSAGLPGIQSISDLGVPYPILLYERVLGRPFAGHRDSVSELVGEIVEASVKDCLAGARIAYRETKRAERVPGFDQAPDFIVPDEFTPVAVIEAKLTEDDGTARDKVARVQQLRNLRDREHRDYDVIACIAGRGFKVRREDMRRLLQATNGKVFTLSTMHLLIENTRIREYRVA